MRRFLAPFAAVALLGLVVVSSADASTSYVARFGSPHGATRLTLGGPNTIYVNAKAMARGSWSETLSMGTCAQPSTKILVLPLLVVGPSGSIARTNRLTSSQAHLLRTGIVRLVRNGVAVCAVFGAVAGTPGPTPSGAPSPSPTTSSSPGSSAVPTASPSGSGGPGNSGGGGASPTPSPTSSPATMQLPLQLQGTGDGTTPVFQAPDNWGVQYSFDCSDLGRAGHFALQVYLNGKLAQSLVDTVAIDGSNAILQTKHPGSTSLRITSECDWGIYAAAT